MSRSFNARCFLTPILFALASAQALAKPMPESAVPEPLKPWIPWVLDQSTLACPQASVVGESTCSYPGTVRLDLTANGASFSQRAQMFAPGILILAGSSSSAWPQNVTVNGVAVPVLANSDRPAIALDAGTYEINGRFEWVKAPERLQLPRQMPLIMTDRGKAIEAPEREGDELWLGRELQEVRSEDALELRVHRLLSDGQPMLLETELVLSVSGQAREVKFGPVLLDGFAPIALDGDLSAKLQPDGRLSVQLRPGEWTIRLTARAIEPISSISRNGAGEFWPEQESLSYAGDATLRSVEISGLSIVDPKQADVPERWHELPAYIFDAQMVASLKTESRGRDPAAPNRLRLEREMWLDFSGHGFSSKDQLSGEMLRDWRVEMRAPYQMKRAQSPDENGAMQPLLVTKSTSGTGVEIRSHQLSLQSSARIEGRGSMPASGFNDTVESANIALNTPPGWKLIAAAGASEANSAWVEKWNVFIAFTLALCALAAFRLGGAGLGAAVTVFVVLSAFEDGAPRLILLAALLFALASHKIRSSGLSRWARASTLFCFALLSLFSIGFLETQLRLALHPQLEQDTVYQKRDGVSRMSSGNLEFYQTEPAAVMAPPPPPPPPAEEPAPTAADAETLDSAVVTGSRLKVDAYANSSPKMVLNQMNVQRKQMLRYAANSVVQAGSAEPDWVWNEHRIAIAGPIRADQQLRLVLMPPWLTSLLRVLISALLIYVLYRLSHAGVDQNGQRQWWWRGLFKRSATEATQVSSETNKDEASAVSNASEKSVLAQALVAGLLLISSGLSFAQSTPSDEILNELKQRLSRGPDCAPNCVQLSDVQVQIDADSFSYIARVHVGAQAEVILPTGEGALAETSLRVDGAVRAFDKRSDRIGLLVLQPGVHVVQLSGQARADRIALDFPIRPVRVQLRLNGWDGSGVRDEKPTSNTLDFSRAQRATASDDSGKTSAQFPPYVRVLRQLRFDLEWRVETTVSRLTNSEAGLSVKVPLLAGERILGDAVQFVDGHAIVAIQANASEASFSSALAVTPELRLEAPLQAERIEVWTIEASPTWHVDFSGLPLSLTPLGTGMDDLQLRFDPLPKEVLLLTLTRPEAAAGPAFRIDQVKLSATLGRNARDLSLNFVLAATQGGRHAIRLPEKAELLNVSRNGSALTLRLREQALELPVNPGENSYQVNFREVRDIGFKTAMPEIDLGLASANISMTMEVPRSRWLLWTAGPMLGPAVLYWARIALLLLLAFALAKSGKTPLGMGSWLLLGIGLSNVHWGVFLLVVAWFLGLQWRLKHGQSLGNNWHRLLQVSLVLLTGAALLMIVLSVLNGLTALPSMFVVGNQSNESSLRWFADASEPILPNAYALSLPLWIYKALILAWAMWLAFALLSWLRYAWTAMNSGGFWRAFAKRVPTANVIAVSAPIPSATAPAPLSADAFQVREAQADDASRIAELGAQYLRLARTDLDATALNALIKSEFDVAQIAKDIVEGRAAYHLLRNRINAEILGFAKLMHGIDAPYQKLMPASYLAHLAVATSGAGLGTQLLNAAIASAKQAGSDELWLLVGKNDEVLQTAYRGFGFERKEINIDPAMSVFGKDLNA
jgi:ribosomal protein S18 acetylase RimI-like enzyme